MSQIFDISINSIHGQKNRKCRAISHLRCDLDVAALHGNDLTGKVQSYADALNIMYFFFPVKAFEDDSLSALRYSFAAVGYVDFNMKLPA